jgi:hypothetical protein
MTRLPIAHRSPFQTNEWQLILGFNEYKMNLSECGVSKILVNLNTEIAGIHEPHIRRT